MRDKKSRGAGTNTPTTQAYTAGYAVPWQKRESSFGLYDYNARWYDCASHDASACDASAIGRFTQADTIVPNPASAKAFDRYAYVENNPVRYNDPSGHLSEDEIYQWTNYNSRSELDRLKADNIELYNILMNVELGDHLIMYKGLTYMPLGTLILQNYRLTLSGGKDCQQLEECLSNKHDGLVVTREVGGISGRVYYTGNGEYVNADFPELPAKNVTKIVRTTTNAEQLFYGIKRLAASTVINTGVGAVVGMKYGGVQGVIIGAGVGFVSGLVENAIFDPLPLNFGEQAGDYTTTQVYQTAQNGVYDASNPIVTGRTSIVRNGQSMQLR